MYKQIQFSFTSNRGVLPFIHTFNYCYVFFDRIHTVQRLFLYQWEPWPQIVTREIASGGGARMFILFLHLDCRGEIIWQYYGRKAGCYVAHRLLTYLYVYIRKLGTNPGTNERTRYISFIVHLRTFIKNVFNWIENLLLFLM